MGQAEKEVSERGAQRAHQHNRPSPDPVREPSPDGRKNKLGEGVNAVKKADRHGRGLEKRGVEREERQDDPKAHEVNQDRQKYRCEGRFAFHFRASKIPETEPNVFGGKK